MNFKLILSNIFVIPIRIALTFIINKNVKIINVKLGMMDILIILIDII